MQNQVKPDLLFQLWMNFLLLRLGKLFFSLSFFFCPSSWGHLSYVRCDPSKNLQEFTYVMFWCSMNLQKTHLWYESLLIYITLQQEVSNPHVHSSTKAQTNNSLFSCFFSFSFLVTLFSSLNKVFLLRILIYFLNLLLPVKSMENKIFEIWKKYTCVIFFLKCFHLFKLVFGQKSILHIFRTKYICNNIFPTWDIFTTFDIFPTWDIFKTFGICMGLINFDIITTRYC